MEGGGRVTNTRELLRECLAQGIGRPPPAEALSALGLSESAPDSELAHALVQRIANDDIAQLCIERTDDAVTQTRDTAPVAVPIEAGDASFLGRLRPKAAGSGEQSVGEMGDVTTLLAVLRAGSLPQRRAAAVRLGQLLTDGMIGEEKNAVEVVLDQLRDPEIALELHMCRALISGPLAREAERNRREVVALAVRLATDIERHWDDELQEEPLTLLSGDARTLLFLHSRELDDVIVAHVSAVIEGDAGNADRALRRMVLAAIRYSGDRRFVPPLTALLEGTDGELVIDAARAISRIDDPRVWHALHAAYERSVVDTERLSLGGALGRLGDVRAADYVRAQLRSQDEHVLMRAIEALRTVGSPEDFDAVLQLLDPARPLIARKVAHTLGRIGDARALPELTRVSREAKTGALRAAAEDAAEEIRARLVLRGEEAPSDAQIVLIEEQGRASLTGLENEPFFVRFRAIRHYVVGRIYHMLGATERALLRFEAAASTRPGWAAPLVVAAMLHSSRDEHAQALALFRRAIDAERARVERNPLVMRALARSFLRRSEQVERDGRFAIARGLLDEVMALDLRRAPSSLRFEIGRRYEALRMLGAR